MAGLYPDCIAAYLIRPARSSPKHCSAHRAALCSYGTMKDSPFSTARACSSENSTGRPTSRLTHSRKPSSGFPSIS